MHTFPAISFLYHFHLLFLSWLPTLILIAFSCTTTNVHWVQARDSSQLGYYLQLYNSINNYRSKHTIPALRWNRTLTEAAEYFAGRILTAPTSFDIEEGLNIFVTPGTIHPTSHFVTGTWYNESVHYNFHNPGFNPVTLNFTQMIWKSSTSIGIGTFTSHNHTSVVAKFYPEGNVRGKFRQNVLPKYKKL